MGDTIQELPLDNLPPTNDEKDMIKWMFPEKEKETEKPINNNNNTAPTVQTTSKFQLEIKSLFFIIVFYMCLSNSYVDAIFNTMIPMTTKSPIILLVCKSFIFAIILLLFFNLYYKN